jgi:hypothetical protein
MSDDTNNIKNTEQISTQVGSQLYYETTSCKKYLVGTNKIKIKCKTKFS